MAQRTDPLCYVKKRYLALALTICALLAFGLPARALLSLRKPPLPCQPPPATDSLRRLSASLASYTPGDAPAAALLRAQLEAILTDGGSPTPPPQPAPPLSPQPAEGEAAAPDEEELPSAIECFQSADASDVCVYINACVDVPDPGQPVGPPVVHLLAHPAGEALLAAYSDTAAAAPAALRRHFAPMAARWPGWTLARTVDEGLKSGYSWDYEDVLEGEPGASPRAVPFGGRFTAATAAPSEALPALLGGAFDGHVVWVEDAWLASSSLGAHLWGFASTVGAPLMSARLANVSLGLKLPPLRNLLVGGALGVEHSTAHDAWVLGQPWASAHAPHGWAWAFGFLHSLLSWLAGGAAPFLGSGRPAELAPGSEALRAASSARDAAVRGYPWGGDSPSQPGAALADALGSWWARAAAGGGGGGFAFSEDLAAAVAARLAPCREEAAAPEAQPPPAYPPPSSALGADVFALPAGAEARKDGPLFTFRLLLRCAVRELASSGPPSPGGIGAKRAHHALDSEQHVGTRIIFTLRDLPASPLVSAAFSWALDAARELLGEDVVEVWRGALSKGGDGGEKGDAALDAFLSPAADAALGALRCAAPLAAFAQWLEHRRTRLCARRLAAVGAKELLVGGLAEANLHRLWASEARSRVGPPGERLQPALLGDLPATAAGFLPPPRSGSDVPILLLDRGAEPNGETVVGQYGRRFHNRGDMERVLQKYNLTFTLMEDVQLRALSFEQQMGLFNAHRLLISVHSAGLSNALFMPPRSSIIEVYGMGMWCPIYARALTHAGHHVFPIYSHLNAPQQDYAFSYGRAPDVVKRFRDNCEQRGSVTASLDADCWHEARGVPVFTPIHEFEAALLLALDAAGAPTPHRGAAFHLLHGVVGAEEWAAGGPPLLAHQDPLFYEKRQWHVAPPNPQSTAP